MSVSWQDLNPALLALFTALGRDEQTQIGPQAEHKDRPRKMVSPVAKQALTIQITTGGGKDASVVREFDEATGELVETIHMHQPVTCRLVCDAISNTDRTWARTTLDRIRLRLRRTRTTEALLALNVSLRKCLDTQEVNFRSEGHVNNRVVMDVLLLARVSESDPEPLDYIQSISFSSDVIKDADGTALPASLQMTNVVVDGAGDEP